MSRFVTHRSGLPRGAFAGLAALALMASAAPALSAPVRAPLLAPAAAVALEVLPGPTTPVITAAPANPTNVATPTFTWTGTSSSYQWKVVDAAGTTVETLTGPETTATLSTPLGDGAYTFSVAPAPTPAPAPGVPAVGAASHAFTVDTIAPPVPRITARPPFPTSLPTPAFAVTDIEAGAVATWNVVAAGGTIAQGPAPVAGPTITLGALATGSYVFQIRQTDAAGNASPPVNEPFAIVAPTVTPVLPAAKPTRLLLPKMNTRRLSPRVGASIRTVRPVLTWTRGPKGTTLYNVQVFRVGAASSSENATVQLTKLRSVFPRARQVRLKGLRRGQCYVWRVWPYIGSRFTAKPLGVSNFCVAAAPKRRARTQ